MRVREIMPTLIWTIEPGATLEEAYEVLCQHGVRQLPVVEAGRLVGIVSERDLRRPKMFGRLLTPKELYAHRKDIRVRDVMTRGVRTISPNAPVALAARTLLRLKVNALPVLDIDRLVGIVTTTDLLAVLVDDEERAEQGTKLELAARTR